MLESISFIQARREVRRGARKAEVSRVTFLDKTSNPTLRAVFFEDAAALVGIVIAVTGLALHQVTGQPVWDAIGSILVGLLLGFVAIYLLRRNMAFLVGQIADPRIHETVLGWLRERPEVERVSTLHLEYVGPGKIFLVGSVDLVGDDAESQAAEELQRLEDHLEERPEIARAVLSARRTRSDRRRSREQPEWLSVEPVMKKIGFLNFGHWTDSPQSAVRSASDTLLQSIDLAVAAEELGADGAYFRVHHFARQLASPFPLLAAVGARTSRIEIGTGVIDMRYENPLYMAEDAGSADLISGGRLQLGISRGSPEQVIDGWRYFGYQPADGEDQADMARRHTEVFLQVLQGQGFAEPNPRPDVPQPARAAPRRAALAGTARAHLVGRGLGRDCALDRADGHAPDVLHAQGRRDR